MALTEEQHEFRKSGIGGSEMAALLGLCPYKQPLDVFNRIVHGVASDIDPDNQPVYWGNALEDAVSKAYQDRTGVKLRNMPGRRHPEMPFLIGHLDRKIEGERRGVEIKNVGFRVAGDWGEQGTDQVAPYYLPQVHHYNLIYDYESFDVAAVVGGQELRIYTVERSSGWDELITETASKFWRDHIETETPPPINFEHGRVLESIRKGIPSVEPDSRMELPPEALHWHQVREQATSQAKSYQAVADGAKVHLLHLIGDSALGLLPDGTGYTQKTVKRSGFQVEPSSYIDLRHTKKPPQPKETKND